MSWLKRVVNVFRGEKLYAELDDEIRFHIDERVDELMAQGHSEESARRQALRRFGNITKEREATRDVNISRFADILFSDLRYGARQLKLKPGFALIAILSLALGIGANSAIFQLINALQLRQLPVPSPERLVAIDLQEGGFVSGWYSGRTRAFTYAQWRELEAHQRAFVGVLAFGTTEFNLAEGGEARYAEGLFLSPNYFDVLEIEPMLGSFPSPADPRGCSGAGALLDHAFWQREFAGDPEVLKRQIRLDGRTFDIVGVTGPTFRGLEPAQRFDVALPLCADTLFAADGDGRLDNKAAWWLTLMGRAKPGWSVEKASAHLQEISPILFRETVPESYRPEAIERYMDNKLEARSGAAGISSVLESYQSPLWILLASTGLVLLLACANLANLLLARASVREREIALRQAIGASRSRLIGQLLLESLLLSLLGGVLGAGVATVLSRSMVLFLSSTGEAMSVSLSVDWHIVGFTAGLAVLTCLLFGWAPALRASKSAPVDALRGGRGAAGEASSLGLRRALVVGQIGLSLILLVGALLFGQSLKNILASDSGMESENLLLAEVVAPTQDMAEEKRAATFLQLAAQIEAIPDVASVSTVALVPFTGSGWNQRVYAEQSDGLENRSAWFNRVGEGYFVTTGIPLLAGRDFTSVDGPSSASVAIINEEMARHLYGEENPLGQTFRYVGTAGENDPILEVIGVVGNSKHYELSEEQRAMAFVPFSQDTEVPNGITYAIRVRGSNEGARHGVKAAMAGLDARLQVQFAELEEAIAGTVLRERLMANLSAGFGLLAALLAALGLYGVMSYLVACRRREIGLRMALGARRVNILDLILREAGLLLAAGLVVGGVGSLALARFAESLLYGLAANDLATLFGGAMLLVLVAILAVLMPLRRALGMQPASVLRDD